MEDVRLREVPERVVLVERRKVTVAELRDFVGAALAAQREAFTTITKREFEYPAVLDAYALVETWADGRGLTRVAPPREVYWGDLDGQGVSPSGPRWRRCRRRAAARS